MKRLLKYLIIGICLALVGICLGTAAWLVGSTSGARWLLSAISRHTGLTVSAKTVEGKLAGKLALDHLDITWPQGNIHVERAEMTTAASAILTGEINIHSLYLKNIAITDNAPPKPPTLEWPVAPAWTAWRRVCIGKLSLENLVYRTPGSEPLHVENITAGAAWKNRQLSLMGVRMISKDGVLSGGALAGFSKPFLELHVTASLTHPVGGMSFFRLAGKFPPGKQSEQMAGTVYVSGSSKVEDPKPLWEAAFDAAMSKQGFPLRNIRLTLPDKSGLVTGNGMLTFKGTEPYLTLQAETAGVDLSRQAGAPVKMAGAVNFRGTSHQYNGSLQIKTFGEKQPLFHLTGDYSGDREKIILSAIKGDMLYGMLSGNLHIDWRQGLAVNGELAGRRLNPVLIDQNWKGEINFNLTGRLLTLDGQRPSGHVALSLSESRLQGRELTGDLRASFVSDDVVIERLSVRGKGFELAASGAIKEKLTFTAGSSDLSGLLPEMHGSIAARGWVRRDRGILSGIVSAQASHWAMKDWKISAADIKTAFDDKDHLSFDVDASFRDISNSQIKADSLSLRGKGNLPPPPRHARQNRQVAFSGKASVAGTLFIQGNPIRLRQSELTLEANKNGVRADLSIQPVQGGLLRGHFTSSSPAMLAPPADGRFSIAWQELDLIFLAPFLPREAGLDGRITGHAEGQLLAGQRLSISGQSSLGPSTLRWRKQPGDIVVDLRQASVNWLWQDEHLSGDLAVTLTEHGKLEGRFSLPVAARIPAVVNEQGPLHATLTGQVTEKGALGMMFPGLIQESRGIVNVDIKLDGRMADPQMSGSLRLSKAEGYLPAAGIMLKDAGMQARLDKDSIIIDAFRAASGSGYVEGSAILRLKEYRLSSFEGRLNGENFQTIYFPELQVQISPKLSFSGTPEKISVRGELLLPDVQIVKSPARGSVQASPDVVREGRIKSTPGKLPFELDANIKLVLGKSVHFNNAGIDAQLGGGLDLKFKDLDHIVSSGEIRVRKGSFQTYGVNLNIVRGRLYYASAPVNQPSLDILAIKQIDEVKAGVAVTGTLQKPLIKLYSEPAMEDTDILAYIVLGHPLSSNTDQAAILAMAARAILTSRQAETLQNQIKGRLGLGSFEISTSTLDANGIMGYKPIKTTSNGKTTSTVSSAGSSEETMVVVGRYLTPKLYVSYGRSIFTGANLFLMRYNISKKWQVESQTGDASGVDLYYKLEFK